MAEPEHIAESVRYEDCDGGGFGHYYCHPNAAAADPVRSDRRPHAGRDRCVFGCCERLEAVLLALGAGADLGALAAGGAADVRPDLDDAGRLNREGVSATEGHREESLRHTPIISPPSNFGTIRTAHIDGLERGNG